MNARGRKNGLPRGDNNLASGSNDLDRYTDRNAHNVHCNSMSNTSRKKTITTMGGGSAALWVDPETDRVTPSAPSAPAEPILAAPTALGWSY